MKPDRVVIGSDNPEAAKRLEQLYAPFNRNHDKIVHMDVRSAELTKYAANVMLATRISLMNEFANLADRLGADIEAVRKGIGTDPRIGHNFIYPGTGYGGSCFQKDVKALIHTASNVGYDAQITRSVEAVNAAQKRTLFDKLMAHFDGDIVGRTIALWGLPLSPIPMTCAKRQAKHSSNSLPKPVPRYALTMPKQQKPPSDCSRTTAN